MLHKDATVGDVHQIAYWDVADSTARLALSVTQDDVGRVAFQADIKKFYILEEYSPMTWGLLASSATLFAIADAGNYFASDFVEDALQNLGKAWRNTCIPIAVSDETTAITAGTAKVTFRTPFAFKLLSVRASLTIAQASGSIFTVDIKKTGISILSIKLTIDNGEKTSTTAAAAVVISDTDLANDVEITIDIPQIGNGTAAGLKVYLIGYVP